MARFRRSFAERNRVLIAVIGLALMAGAFVATLNLQALPVVGGGAVHEAVFAESGGLRAGNEVRVAGVRVGEVTSVELHGREVVVRFRAKDVELPDQTSAAIKVKTMLGQKYLAVDPLGSGTLAGPIPLERTTTPYDVNAAFSDLSTNLGEIDTVQLEESFDALADAFRDTPEAVQEMVGGLTALSRTISTRDDDLAELLAATTQTTGVLAERNEEIAALVNDGSALFGELQRRRAAVRAMLRGTADLGNQVRGLVRDNEKSLAPALKRLDRVSAILNRNQKNLERALEQLGPYYRVLASATGNGRWADAYLCGLFDEHLNPVMENDVVRNCQPGGAR